MNLTFLCGGILKRKFFFTLFLFIALHFLDALRCNRLHIDGISMHLLWLPEYIFLTAFEAKIFSHFGMCIVSVRLYECVFIE